MPVSQPASDPFGPIDPVTLAARLAPLITPCIQLKTLGRGTQAWQDAADLLLIMNQAELHILLDLLVVEMGPSALDVSHALVGIIRASVHPRAGSPTLRENAYRSLIAWAREMRAAQHGGSP